MKEAFIMCVENDCEIIHLQVAVAVRRKSDGEKGVTFFSLSEDSIKDDNKWLFKIDGKAKRI